MQHYKTHHFVCDVPGCLEENLSVFSDRMELMRHKQQAHHQRVVVDVWFHKAFHRSFLNWREIFRIRKMSRFRPLRFKKRRLSWLKILPVGLRKKSVNAIVLYRPSYYGLLKATKTSWTDIRTCVVSSYKVPYLPPLSMTCLLMYTIALCFH